MSRTIIQSDLTQEEKLKDFATTFTERQRYLLYTDKIHAYFRIIKYETDEKLCYFSEEVKPRFGTKGFIQRTTKEGFSYDKSKKKLSIWFGRSILKIGSDLINVMLIDLGIVWALSMNIKLKQIATRALLEKIIKGKITNPIEYTEHYLKYTVRIKGLSVQLYYNLVTSGNFDCDIYNLNTFLKYSKDPNLALKDFDNINKKIGRYEIPGILNLCKILDTKIDWSLSRTDIDKETKRLKLEVEGYDLINKEGSSIFGYDKYRDNTYLPF